MKVIGPVAVDVKRFYVDAKFVTNSPICKKTLTQELMEDYLSYPQVGDKDLIYLYCKKCNAQLSVPRKIIAMNIVLDYDIDNAIFKKV